MPNFKDITISIASSEKEALENQNTSALIVRKYEWRGYKIHLKPDSYNSKTITLIAYFRNKLTGTLTIGFDNVEGLSVDKHFSDEVNILRLRPHFLCEFTKLAAEGTNVYVIGALFHSAFIIAHYFKKASYVLIEVNPRHVQYYKKMLGFKILSDPVHNKSVNATAVLLGKSFEQVEKCIKFVQHGGRFNHRSLYYYFFSLEKEKVITQMLSGFQKP